MWRQNKFPGKSDSDQSISDEEDFNGVSIENCVSLTGNTQKQERWEFQSRLDLLRGGNELSSGSKIGNLIHEKGTSVVVEDEVEMPDFPDERGGFIFSLRKGSAHKSNDEAFYNDEDACIFPKNSITSSAKKLHEDNGDLCTFGIEKQPEACPWSMVNKEAETLINLNENALSSWSAYSKANKTQKGVRGKPKPKFSFHFQSHKDGLSQPSIAKDENIVPSKVHNSLERLEMVEHGMIENLNPELHEDCLGEDEYHSEVEPAGIEVLGHGFVEHSVVELLDGLQDKNIMSSENAKRYCRTRGKRTKPVTIRGISSLGNRIIDNEDQPELLASVSPSDDEANYQNLNLANVEIKNQTMADRFLEALAATSMNNDGVFVPLPKRSGAGLFGKLQQVMQSEKERDAEFLKKLQMGAGLDGEPCTLVVKILSRYFDAKLTVCRCAFGEDIKEGSHSPGGSQTKFEKGGTRTVIFSPRVCSDVDLESGKLICIHPPWKEVHIGNDEHVILTTYFSQIQV